MASFHSGPITGLGSFKGKIFAASGNTIKVIGQDSKSIIKQVILDGGLIRKMNKDFIIAGDHIYNFDLNSLYILQDWKILPKEHILDAQLIDGKIFILTVHGYVVILNDFYEKIALVEPIEPCVLYSGLVVSYESEILIVYGTIFSGIQVYKLTFGDSGDFCLEKYFSLLGHKGSIFALKFRSPHYLGSASDDRTVCVWDLSMRKRIFCGSGHRARIWSIIFISSYSKNCIVSASEDGDLRVWDFIEEECLSILEGHMGKHVWSVACVGDSLISGGNDGSVRKWNLNANEFIEYSWKPEDEKIVKSFFVNSYKNVILTLDNGEIVESNLENGYILKPLSRPLSYLANYSTMSCQLIGGLSGMIYDFQNESCYQPEEDKVVKVFESKGQVLINYATGKIFLGKEQISLSGAVTSFLFSKGLFYVGFRYGNIAIFDSNYNANAIIASFSLRSEAITSFIEFKNQIAICDRSGHLMFMENFEILSDLKIHQGFLEQLLVLNGNLLAAGFYQKNFFIYDIKRCVTMIKIPCGGGHRQWQLYYDPEVSNEMVFAYLRMKHMHVVKFVLKESNNHECLIPAFHGREIRALHVFYEYIITGDEEGTMILSEYVDFTLTPISYIKNAHKNGIKSIKHFADDFLISVGSGEELKIWRLCNRNLYLIKSYTSLTDDVRFMDVVHRFPIFVAGSDGNIRVFDEELKLIRFFSVGSCVIKLEHTGVSLIAADSKGNLHITTKGSEPITTKSFHKNAILSLLIISIFKASKETQFIITGGDDGEIAINQELLVPKMHYSSVTALCKLYIDDTPHFVSVGLDRRVVVWSLLNRSPVNLLYTRIDDVSNCFVYDHQCGILIIVGNGIEILRII